MTHMHTFDWLAPGDRPTLRQLDSPQQTASIRLPKAWLFGCWPQ